jgi:integrase
MASISKFRDKFRVQYYDEDGKKKGKLFATKAEAKRFAALLDLSQDEKISKVLFCSLLTEYMNSVTSKKKGARSESLRIQRLMQRPFASLPISSVSQKTIEEYIEERSAERTKSGGFISPATIRKEVILLSAIFNYAIRKRLLSKNPTHNVEKPKEPPHRERVASDEDIAKLLQVAGWDGESKPQSALQLTMLAFLFACRTGMRSGEIIKLEKSWIQGRVIHLPREATKTDAKRDVALCNEALRLLNLALAVSRERSARVFDALNDANRDALFRKARDRAGLGAVCDSQGRVICEGLNFHDSRATFATWAASPDPKTGAPRLDVLALARQTGHHDLRQLQKYYRKSAEEIADQLND